MLSTILTSSSVNPYNSYTSRSACGVPVGRDDLALVYGLLLVRDRRGQLVVQIQGGLDQRDHPIAARDVGGIGEVDGRRT